MSSAVTRIGDYSTGHGHCWSSVPLKEGSSNVFINGKSCGRAGDHYPIHGGCPDHDPDQCFISKGSSTVFVNGKSIGRVDDPAYKDTVKEGSPNVYAGG